jgi:hypothetical protein
MVTTSQSRIGYSFASVVKSPVLPQIIGVSENVTLAGVN